MMTARADKNMDKILAEEAEIAERTRDAVPNLRVRSRRLPKDPSEVYSLRVPVGRLEEVRRLAATHHETPAALLRRWVLERLDEEVKDPGKASLAVQQQIADVLRQALSIVEERRSA
jgi:hypothetical protein